MKQIDKNELFGHLSGFLKAKGIELKDGSYTNGIQKSCGILADMINLSQQGIERAKTQIDQKADRLRQMIHEKTAPKTATPPTAAAPASPSATAAAEPSPKKSAPRKPRKTLPSRRRRSAGK